MIVSVDFFSDLDALMSLEDEVHLLTACIAGLLFVFFNLHSYDNNSTNCVKRT